MPDKRSRDVGVKLAQVLRAHAFAHRDEEDLDVAEVLRGAAEYLRDKADPPKLVDESRTDLDERQN